MPNWRKPTIGEIMLEAQGFVIIAMPIHVNLGDTDFRIDREGASA
jgi:hypothetical protein